MKIRDLNEANLGAEKDYVSPGVQQLKTDQYMGMYKFSKDVAGHDGKKQHAPKGEPNKVYKDAPVVVGYSDADDKMTKAAMKGKVKQTVDSGSMEPPNVNKHSPLSKKTNEGKACPQCGSTSCTCEPGKCNCEPVEENLRKWFKDKWVRFGPDGKIRGDCARGDDSEGKPKCLPQSKAHALGKKGRASAAARKRREDPNPERRGAAKNVATKKESALEDTTIPFNTCPGCGGDIVHESQLSEKQDACYHKVKARYKVWPSAYASGALVQCRKKGAKNWGKKSEGLEEAIKLSHARYLRSHGEKARGGHGNWMFTSKEYGEPSKDEIFMAPPGKLGDAAKLAAKWARANGHYTIYVMEDGLDEASVATMRKYFAGDEHARDASKTSTMRDFFSLPDNDNPIKPSRGKTFTSKGEYMRWLQSQKKTKENVEENVIYQLDPNNPMDDTEVLVLGGAGRYTLAQLRNKARREAAALSKDLETDHGDTFRKASYNIKQLANTLNTIVAAYNELTDIRKKGGARSRGIRAEDAKVFAESFDLMEKWSQKYKNSINCSNPKGFSQKAHCAGRKK